MFDVGDLLVNDEGSVALVLRVDGPRSIDIREWCPDGTLSCLCASGDAWDWRLMLKRATLLFPQLSDPTHGTIRLVGISQSMKLKKIDEEVLAQLAEWKMTPNRALKEFIADRVNPKPDQETEALRKRVNLLEAQLLESERKRRVEMLRTASKPKGGSANEWGDYIPESS